MSIANFFRKTIWPRRGVVGWLAHAALLPFSAAFGVGVGLRGAAYRLAVLRSRIAPIPVVSIGNLSVGGTGKTPLTLWLAQNLVARGKRPAIVLRGYRRHSRGVKIVSRGAGCEMSVREAGDEPAMLAANFSGPVITATRRIDGARAAADLGCDVVVLDDGFQHRAIARAFDIVLLDARPASLLPAGPMRERTSALRRADAVVLVEKGSIKIPVPRAARGKAVYRMRMEAVELIEVVGGKWVSRPLGLLPGKQVVAVSGIGQPESFYDLIRQWEAEIREVFEFPDHHDYGHVDWQNIIRRSQWSDLIVTTEKDLVKLEAYPFPTGKLLALRIRPQIDQGDHLIDSVLKRIGAG